MREPKGGLLRTLWHSAIKDVSTIENVLKSNLLEKKTTSEIFQLEITQCLDVPLQSIEKRCYDVKTIRIYECLEKIESGDQTEEDSFLLQWKHLRS